MTNWISHDQDWRKHGKRGKLNFRTQKLFGMIRDTYRKINRSKPATAFATRETMEALKDYQVEFEQRKSKAFVHLFYQARAY